jgi:hypothetical protein
MDKLTLNQAVAIYVLLQKILWTDSPDCSKERYIPFKTRYLLVKLYTLFSQEFQIFDQLRLSVVRELGEPVEGADPDYREVPTSKSQEFTERIREVLHNTPSTVKFDKLSMADADILQAKSRPDLEFTLEEMHLFMQILVEGA